MNVNPVRDATYIVRCQVEYSTATQTAVLRCLLEKPATGQRCSFTDLEALLVMLRAEIRGLQAQIIAVDEQSENC